MRGETLFTLAKGVSLLRSNSVVVVVEARKIHHTATHELRNEEN